MAAHQSSWCLCAPQIETRVVFNMVFELWKWTIGCWLSGDGSVGEGDPPHGDVDVTLTLNQNDLEALFQGQVNAFHAYMGGRLQVDGDLRAANNLQQLIEKVRSWNSGQF